MVLGAARNQPEVLRLWLFGSRARGTASPQSDYDFAMEWTGSEQGWASFAGELRERNPSLCQLDLVRMDFATEDLQSRIRQEGKRLYDRSQSEN